MTKQTQITSNQTNTQSWTARWSQSEPARERSQQLRSDIYTCECERGGRDTPGGARVSRREIFCIVFARNSLKGIIYFLWKYKRFIGYIVMF